MVGFFFTNLTRSYKKQPLPKGELNNYCRLCSYVFIIYFKLGIILGSAQNSEQSSQRHFQPRLGSL